MSPELLVPALLVIVAVVASELLVLAVLAVLWVVVPELLVPAVQEDVASEHRWLVRRPVKKPSFLTVLAVL